MEQSFCFLFIVTFTLLSCVSSPNGIDNTSNRQQLTDQLDQYDDFAQYCSEQNGITFITITDITRRGLTNTHFVLPMVCILLNWFSLKL